MNMNWIPVRVNLADDRVVVRISRLLCERCEVPILSASCPQSVRKVSARCLTVGALVQVWAQFDQQSVDGFIAGLTAEDLDDHVGIAGFCAIVAECGWMQIESGGLRIPMYDKWFGKCGRRRLMENRRKADSRHGVRMLSAKHPHPMRTKCGPEEEGEEEVEGERKKNPPTPLDRAGIFSEPVIDAMCSLHRIGVGDGSPEERTTHLFARHGSTVRKVEHLLASYDEADVIEAISRAVAAGKTKAGEVGFFLAGVVRSRHVDRRPPTRREEAQDDSAFVEAVMSHG
jgi:hypothetical protein